MEFAPATTHIMASIIVWSTCRGGLLSARKMGRYGICPYPCMAEIMIKAHIIISAVKPLLLSLGCQGRTDQAHPLSCSVGLCTTLLCLHGGLRVEDIDFLEIITQILPFIGAKNSQRETNQCPEVNHGVVSTVMFTQFMDLGMAVVACGNAVVCFGGLDLLIFDSTVLQALFLESGLKKAAPAPTAEVVGFVWGHINEILFSDNGFDHKSKIIGNGVTIGFSDNLAGILYRKFDFEILVPVGVDFQLSFTNPFCIVFIDIFDDKFVLYVEFFQSCQD